MRIHYLTLDQMIVVIERTLGPPAQAHLRDVGLLQGAVARPAAGMMGAEALFDLTMAVASGKLRDVHAIAEVLRRLP